MTTFITLAVTPMDGDDQPENWPWSELVGVPVTVCSSSSALEQVSA